MGRRLSTNTFLTGRSPRRRKSGRASIRKLIRILLDDPAFQKLHQQFRTKIDLGIELLEAAIQHKVPFSVLLFDSWYLAEELVSMARYRKKDWISMLKKNRNLETNSFVLKDAAGKPIRLEGPHIAVEDLMPHIPPSAYRAVTVGDTTYWTFTLAVRIPGLGKVRLVISFRNAELTGTYAVLVTNRLRLECAKDHRPVFATLADRNLLSGRQGTSGPGRVSHAQRRSHWETLVSGVRGVFVLASGLSPPVTEKGSMPIKTIGEACRQQAQALIEAVDLVCA